MLHEMLVELLRRSPELLLALLGDQISTLGASGLRFEPDEPNLSQLAEIDADLVLRVYDSDGTLRCALVIEVQLRIDQAKPRSWHAYQAGTHRRLGCPTYVIVVAVDADVAVWAGGPFSSGQTVFRPIVIGPQQVPVVVDVDSARGNLNLALLSGLAHRHEPEVLEIGQALWHALDQPRREDRDHYWDVFLHAIGEATRRTMMSLFHNYVPQSEWGKKHYAEGQARGRAQAMAEMLALLLEGRGLSMRSEHHAAVDACTDAEVIGAWARRAITATCIDEVFAD
ncbi:MAG: hypothetical protein AB1Z98_30265 [Nannocystaceae bacterium]